MSGRALLLTATAALSAMVDGCSFQAAVPAPAPRIAEDDPCAERLHDLCGDLLRYYIANDDLPERLTEAVGPASGPAASSTRPSSSKSGLRPGEAGQASTRPARSSVPLVCPTSGQPYVYDRAGLPIAGRAGRLIVYDSGPAHSGHRWGILAELPRPGFAGAEPGKPLVLRVICLPEKALPAKAGE